MPIEGVCPSCGAKFDLAHALTDGEARQALAAALQLPAPLARLIVPYLSLHAPGQKRIAWRKLARLLRELTALIEAGTVMRERERYAAPLELWRDGLEKVVQAADKGDLTLPLEGHGYLTKVVWTEAKRAAGRRAAAERPLHPSHRHVPPSQPSPRQRGEGFSAPSPPPEGEGFSVSSPPPEGEGQGGGKSIAEHLEALKRSVGKR